ncbi:MAG: DHA2 family efflux MFS transporter permease subunit [Hyphomicrobiaceae bacterium]
MTEAGATAQSPPAIPEARQPLSLARRLLVLLVCVLCTTVFNASMFVASTLLPQMQGAMSATQDEISWAITFNILATAVATPTTGWLVGRFGRHGVMVFAIAIFTVATFLCGAATSLQSLVLWRILQGLAGAPIIPLSQTILLDSFDRKHHGIIIAIYGMTGIIGPTLGPVLGGMLAEATSWRWAFYMLVPFGVVASIGIALALPRDLPLGERRLDWIGFLTFSLAIGCLQLVLARGEREDWFQSNAIILIALLAGLAFYLFLAHSLTYDRPFLNLRLLLDRNYALGLCLIAIFGMLNFTPMVLLPSLLRQHAGFPDSLIGYIISWRGGGAMTGFFLAMYISKLDPRIGMGLGFGLQVTSGLWLASIDLNVSHGVLAANSFIQGLAVGTIWVPMTVATFSTIDNRYLAEATALYHLMRNLGSSLFISLSVAEVVRTTGANYSRMTESVTPYSEALQLPGVSGGWSIETLSGLARLAKEIDRQAAMIGYINAFYLYTAASLAALVLVLLVRPPRRRLT